MVPPPFQFPFKSLLIKKLYHKRAWIAELKLLYLNEKNDRRAKLQDNRLPVGQTLFPPR